MDRLVVFKSDRILHRVLPSYHERYCLTIWLDAPEEKINQKEDMMLKVTQAQMNGEPEEWENFLGYLRGSPVQRLLSRAVYEEEYINSIEECMKDTEGLHVMLSTHKQHIERMKQNMGLWMLIEKLKDYRLINNV